MDTKENIRDELGRYKKGCSGNPDGKPAGTKTYLTGATKNLETIFDRLVELVASDKEHVAIKAIQTILDRVEGKPVQSVETNVDGEVTFSWKGADISIKK